MHQWGMSDVLTERNELFQMHDDLFKEIPVAGVSDKWTRMIDTIGVSSKKLRISTKLVHVESTLSVKPPQDH